MSEPTDKALHDWVRQSLETYHPDYDPTDWRRLQHTLQRRRWQRWRILLGGLLLLGFTSWLIIRSVTKSSEVAEKLVVTKSQKSPVLKPINTPNPTSINSSVNHPFSLNRRRSVMPMLDQRAKSMEIPNPDFIPTIAQTKPLPTQLTQRIYQRQPVAFSREETAIAHQLITSSFGSDSTSYQVLERNVGKWPDAVIVCDFTTSMYPYSTQLFAWFRKHTKQGIVNGMVFFTDCDSLGQQTRPGGPPGQMFVTRDRNPTSVLSTLMAATRNTVRNEDDAENNVEALLFAQKQFPDAKHLILLADNMSTVKDMALLKEVKKPVHVIVCGTTGSDTTIAYQPNYYEIASRTNGSLHTLEDDLIPTALSSTTTLRVGPRYFRYLPRRHRFKPTTFDHRPKRILKFIWL